MSEAAAIPQPDEPGSESAAGATAPPSDQALQREHALRSLLQFGSETSLSTGVYDAIDLLLYNLMGQFRTSRSALWLLADDGGHDLVLMRNHGFRATTAQAAGTLLGHALLEVFTQRHEPVPGEILAEAVGPQEAERLGLEGIALVAPVMAHGQAIGWLALGHKLQRTAYSPEDLQILQASLGFAGVLIHNATMHNRVLEANRRLQASHDRLAELDRLKTEFLANVNHELRTPIAIVMGALECLDMTLDPEAEARDLLRAAMQSSARLKKLFENLLTFAELRSDRVRFDIATIDLRERVGAHFKSRQPGVTSGLRELTFEAPDVLPLGRCDGGRVVQILDELIDNAVKFTPRGSAIQLRIRLRLQDGGTWLCVEVADDGDGIPAERLEDIFDTFVQRDGSATRTVGGLGMGLSFARQLAEHMGCRLVAASTPGHGSTFTLMVPAA